MTTKKKSESTPTIEPLSKLRVGIVSRVEHASSHAKALEDAGFIVEMLGGEVRHIPPRIDIVVVRTQSCSHSAQLGSALTCASKHGERCMHRLAQAPANLK